MAWDDDDELRGDYLDLDDWDLDNWDLDDWQELVYFGPIQHGGDVYYDPRTNRFIQLRKRSEDKLVFGEPCEYFEDAQTCLLTQTLSCDYLDGLVKVEHIDIDKFDKAEHNDIGWCIKGARSKNWTTLSEVSNLADVAEAETDR